MRRGLNIQPSFRQKGLKVLLSISACMSVLSLQVGAQAEGADKAHKIDLIEVDARINELMRREDMVGLSIAIVENGKLQLVKGYGETRRGSRDPVTKDTVFRWASLSKAAAAAAALIMVEDGFFEIDAPIETYALTAALPKARKALTLDDVLSHRSGVKRNAFDRDIEAGKFPKPLREKISDAAEICEVGVCHSYQNVIFDAVSEMIETATDLPYKAVISERLFRPLGMDTASVTLEGLTRSKSWARPHNKNGEIKSGVKPTYYRIPAAAGVNSSGEDLGRWMLAQMGANPMVLSTEMLDTLQRPRVLTPREEKRMRRNFKSLRQSRYGYGWRMYKLLGHDVVGHRGAVEGYRSAILFDRELKTGVAILWNSGSYRPIGLQLEIFDQIYGQQKRDWMRLQLSK